MLLSTFGESNKAGARKPRSAPISGADRTDKKERKNPLLTRGFAFSCGKQGGLIIGEND